MSCVKPDVVDVEETRGIRRMLLDKTVLIIDDVAELAETLADEVVACRGVAVVARNANDFMRRYLDHEPDTIVLDVVMPGTDGIELIRWLAARRCRAKICLITGNHLLYAKAALEVGAAFGLLDIVLLQKPFTPKQFISAIASPRRDGDASAATTTA